MSAHACVAHIPREGGGFRLLKHHIKGAAATCWSGSAYAMVDASRATFTLLTCIISIHDPRALLLDVYSLILAKLTPRYNVTQNWPHAMSAHAFSAGPQSFRRSGLKAFQQDRLKRPLLHGPCKAGQFDRAGVKSAASVGLQWRPS